MKRRIIKKTSVRKRVVKKPMQSVSSETKVLDTNDTGFSIGTTAKIDHLSNIDGGTNINQRVGTKVSPMYILGRLEFVHNPSATVTFVRVIIFQDLQQVLSTTPSSLSLLQSTDTRSPLNIQNRGRFKIIYDDLFNLNNFDKTGIVYKFNRKVPMSMQWSNNTGTNIQKNGLYIFFLSSDNTNSPLGSYYLRLSYKDN